MTEEQIEKIIKDAEKFADENKKVRAFHRTCQPQFVEKVVEGEDRPTVARPTARSGAN